MNIELLKPHTHAGVLHAPGDRLELDEGAGAWLIECGVAKLTHGADESALKLPSTTRKGD